MAGFNDPEPDVMDDLSADVAESRRQRSSFGRAMAFVILVPVAIWFVAAVVMSIIQLLRP